MGLIEDANAITAEILLNVTEKVTDRSIKRVDVAKILNDLVALIIEGSPFYVPYSESNLVNGGSEYEPNFYLLCLDQNGNLLPVNSKPVFIELNGNSFECTFSESDPDTGVTWPVPRIYGFANNQGPQNITVTYLIPLLYSPLPPPVDNGFPYTFPQTFN